LFKLFNIILKPIKVFQFFKKNKNKTKQNKNKNNHAFLVFI